jgi:hypothetical protein
MTVRNVLTVQGVPERAYLERWGRELGISDRIGRILSSSQN